MTIGTSLGGFFQDKLDMMLHQFNNHDNNVFKPDTDFDNIEITPQHEMNQRRDNDDPRNIYDDSGNIVDYDESSHTK